jgi:adenosylcobinamide-GDP ribazoletransferase
MHKIGAIILMCVFSRQAMVFEIFLFPYARQEGKGKVFTQGINQEILMIATLLTLVCAVIVFKVAGFLILVLAAFIAYIFGKLIARKIGGITGDTLGAANEVVETAVLLTACILERAGLLWMI